MSYLRTIQKRCKGRYCLPCSIAYRENIIPKLPIVTLITDFGNRDFYAGALKGTLLRHVPDLRLVDISHEVESHNILHAAFIAVNCVYDVAFRWVLVRHAHHFFIAPDNGVLTLFLGSSIDPKDIRQIFPNASVVSEYDCIAEAVGAMAQAASFEAVGSASPALRERIGLRPVITANRIRGTIIHADIYGNAIVNIDRATWEKTAGGRSFSLYFKRHDPITRLSDNYCDVASGEPLCLFNNAGYLEIAINMERAVTLLGLKVEDVIEVVFE
jgi:S-adenosyl-L-methionine hydrolase (adenosine-forming)